MTDQHTLIDALSDPACFAHPAEKVDVVETHISWVLLVGDFAYKIKKSVDMGFLDFSTLAKRKFYCEEELRLNRRLAEQLYLQVVRITGEARHPVLNGEGEAIEYAVRMRRFDQRMQFDHLVERGELSDAIIDRLATRVSGFHQSLPRATHDEDYGTVQQVWAPVAENFTHIDEVLHEPAIQQRLQRLRQWSEQQHQQLRPAFVQRKRDGFIRECHGDMHLRNIALFQDEVVVFDGIEFSADLRWIDVISEIAFLTMDLEDRDQGRLAQRFLNRYLEHTGDYAGCAVLRFYQAYRALVRAKVDAIRLTQDDTDPQEKDRLHGDLEAYLDLAGNYTRRRRPVLVLNHGVSGSGKTYHSQTLVEALPAIRLRSDVERKRLFESAQASRDEQGIGAGLYRPEVSDKVYAHLLQLGRTLLEAGHSVIVDAAFLQAKRRAPFAQLAGQLDVPLVIVHYGAEADTLRRRVQQRSAENSDASDADLEVLEYQLQHYQGLDEDERQRTINVATDGKPDMHAVARQIRQRATP